MSLSQIDATGPTMVGNAAILVPYGQNIIYVHNNGASQDLPGSMGNALYPSVASAVASGRANRGDIVQMLPGHAESVAAADAWNFVAAGITVRGPAYGTPAVITWTATVGSILLDQADTVIDGRRGGAITDTGIIFACSPASLGTVAAPFTASAARCQIRGCTMIASTGATDLVTDLVTANVATDFLFDRNFVYGTTGTPSTIIKTTGASHRLNIHGNSIEVPIVTSATGVLIDVSNAATSGFKCNGNFLSNTTASSKFVLKPHATTVGEMTDNRVAVLFGAASGVTGAGVSTFTTGIKFFNNRVVNVAGAADALMGTAST